MWAQGHRNVVGHCIADKMAITSTELAISRMLQGKGVSIGLVNLDIIHSIYRKV